MRTHFLSLLVGGLLVAGGWMLGASRTTPAVEAGVAADAQHGQIVTSGDGSSAVFVWRLGRGTPEVTKWYAVSSVDGTHELRSTHFVPAAEGK